MASSTPFDVQTELTAIRAENKQIIRLLRRIKAKQDDPDGSKAQERASKNGFSKPLNVSDELKSFLGLGSDELISRSNVTKGVSNYVKEHDLQDKENGRNIIPDAKLKSLLKAPEDAVITFLNIQKYLTQHFPKSEKPEKPKKKVVEEEPVEVVKVEKRKAAEPAAEAAPAAKRPVLKKKVPTA